MFIKYFKALLNDKSLIKRSMEVSIPLMLQALVVSSVTLVDNLMIGQLGDLSISGVSSANRYYMIMYYTAIGTIAACIIFLAQYYGANDESAMKETFRISLVSSLFLTLIFSLFAFFKADFIIKFIIDDKDVIDIGSRYLRICCFSYIPMVISNCIGQAMRALGKPKVPMYISIFSILLNVFFDYVLIFGCLGFPRLEIEGAAIATVIARFIEMLIYIYVLRISDFPFETRIRDIFKFRFILFKTIMFKAFPLILNEFLFTFGQTSILKCYSFRGVIVNTAYTIANMLADLFFVLFSGMSTAVSVLIGTPLGAGDLEKAKDNGYKLLVFSCMIALVFASLMFLSSFLIPLLYRNASIESITLAKQFLRVMAFFFIIYTFNTHIYFTLRSGGETTTTLFMDSLFMWTMVVPIVYYLAYHTNINVLNIYVVAQCTDFIKMFLSYYLFRKEKWVKNLTI